MKKVEKMKNVKAYVLNDDGDLVMGIVSVPATDKRPAVPAGSRIAQNPMDAQAGNPGKNGNGPVTFEE